MEHVQLATIDVAYLLDKDSALSRTFVETDPATGIVWLAVFNDDGFGNGFPLLHVPLGKLTQLVASCNK